MRRPTSDSKSPPGSKAAAPDPEHFYKRIKPRLMRRIGREIRLARYVIDIGRGSCDLVRYLAETYEQEVTGVDVSRDCFPGERQTDAGQRYRCVKGDGANLAFAADGSADAVVCMWALHEMDRPDAILRETFRVLRRGGEIFIVEFPKDSLAQELWDEDYFTPDSLRELVRDAGFHNPAVRTVEKGQVMWGRGYRPGPVRRYKKEEVQVCLG